MMVKRFERLAGEYSSRLAVKVFDRTLTYGQLNRLSNQLAYCIVSQDKSSPAKADEQVVALLFEHVAKIY